MQHFPLDVLKVDKMFTDSLASEGEQVNIALAVTQLGQRLGLDLVAEGVEQESQVQALLRLGCPIAQGFFFAGPLPTEEIDRLMRCASIAAWKAHEGGPTPEIGAPKSASASAEARTSDHTAKQQPW